MCFLSPPAIQPRVSTDIPAEHVSRPITRHPNSLEHPNFQFSNCTGRKRAVCVSLESVHYTFRYSLYALKVGINYTGQNSQLDGCVNDAKNMHRFLIGKHERHF